jgi:membrane protease YdiL (CAAX protease family)
MDESPVQHPTPASPRRKRAKSKLPLWAFLPLLFAWIWFLCANYLDLRASKLEGWALWRVADQDLRIETTRMPVPWDAAEVAGDREGSDLLARWAEVFERSGDPRSKQGAAILWKMAGDSERASAVGPAETGHPDLDKLVTALVRDRQPDRKALEYWGLVLSADEEVYWWEEQLYLHLAGRANPEITAAVRARAEQREGRWVAMTWATYAITFGLGLAGLGGFVFVAKRGLDFTALKRVPAVFRRIHWRKPLAAVALSDLLAALLFVVLSWIVAAEPEITIGHVIVQDTIWRSFPALLACVLVFRRPTTAIRALGIDRPFAWPMVLAALGISLTLEILCWGLLPQDTEDLAIYVQDTWGFGVEGLGYGLLSACVLAPVCEEIVYRGFLFNAISARFGLLPGLVIANLIFTAIHGYPLDSSAGTFLFGVVASLLYRATGSLGAAMVMHSMFNLYCTIVNWTSAEAVYW